MFFKCLAFSWVGLDYKSYNFVNYEPIVFFLFFIAQNQT